MRSSKPTFIYGLVDPRSQELRYVGKTVLSDPRRRLFVHQWRARTTPHKRHSMAWLLNLAAVGLVPDVIVIEVVPSGEDWVEAEQFWIGYFRMIGANLCNHTAGGEGQPVYRQPPEVIAKRIRRGAAHHSTGKPMLPHVKEALRVANEKMRADPVRMAVLIQKRTEALRSPANAERMRHQNARLLADPDYVSRLRGAQSRALSTPEFRAKFSEDSKRRWAVSREQIIAAQNAGRGDEWRRKQSEAGRARLTNMDHPLRLAAVARRKLTDADVAEIRFRCSRGEGATRLAREFGVSQSTVSHIKSGRHR